MNLCEIFNRDMKHFHNLTLSSIVTLTLLLLELGEQILTVFDIIQSVSERKTKVTTVAKIKNNKASVGNVISKSKSPFALIKKVIGKFIYLYAFRINNF